jgi:hypothetical protein
LLRRPPIPVTVSSSTRRASVDWATLFPCITQRYPTLNLARYHALIPRRRSHQSTTPTYGMLHR